MSSFVFSEVSITSSSIMSYKDNVTIFMLIDCDYGPYDKTIVTSLAQFKLLYGIRYIGGNDNQDIDAMYYRTKLPRSYLMALWLLELGYTLELIRVRVPIPKDTSTDSDISMEFIDINNPSDSSRESLLLTKNKNIYSYPEYNVRYVNNTGTELNPYLKEQSINQSNISSYLLPIDKLIEEYVDNGVTKYRLTNFAILTTYPVTINSINGDIPKVIICSNLAYGSNNAFVPNLLSGYLYPIQLGDGEYTKLELLSAIVNSFITSGFAVYPLVSSYSEFNDIPFININGVDYINIYSMLSIPIFKSLYWDGHTGNIRQYLTNSNTDISGDKYKLDHLQVYTNRCMDWYNRCKLIGNQGIIYVYSRYPSYINNINISISKLNESFDRGSLITDYLFTMDLIDFQSNSIIYSESYTLDGSDSLSDWNTIINNNSYVITVDIRKKDNLPLGSWTLGNIPEVIRCADINDYIDTLDEFIKLNLDIESSIIIDSGIYELIDTELDDYKLYLDKLVSIDKDRSRLLFTDLPINESMPAFSSLIDNLAPFNSMDTFRYNGYQYPSYMYSLFQLSVSKSSEGNSRSIGNNRFIANTGDVPNNIIKLNSIHSNQYGIWIDKPISYILGRCYPLDDAILLCIIRRRLISILNSYTSMDTFILGEVVGSAILYAKSYVNSTASVSILNYEVYERSCIITISLDSTASISKGIPLNINIDLNN